MNKTVCEIDRCTGCGACINICPKNCISLVDNVRSLNSFINKNMCVECNLCKIVCQVSNNSSTLIEKKFPIEVLEGNTTLKLIDRISSSGGYATTLGLEFIKRGGYVVGVRNDINKFVFDLTNNPDELIKFSGSKYVKVNTDNIYIKVRDKLNNKENVLFVGTPCQIAGLKMFLLKDYENLYTIDLICHGTPSEKVLKKFLAENNIESFKDLKFRNKRDFRLFVNNYPIRKGKAIDSYTIGFLNAIFYTENCYECPFATTERIGDITIGDSWGSPNEGKGKFHNLSLILIQNDKGLYLNSLIKDKFILTNANFDLAKKNNHQLVTPSKKNTKSRIYFDNFKKKKTTQLMFKILPKNIIRQYIKEFLWKIKLLK